MIGARRSKGNALVVESQPIINLYWMYTLDCYDSVSNAGGVSVAYSAETPLYDLLRIVKDLCYFRKCLENSKSK